MELLSITKNSPPQQQAELTELLLQFCQSLGKTIAKDLIADALENMMTSNKGGHAFLALVNDTAVGMCYCNLGSGIPGGGDYLWINGIYISETYRGKGHGLQLLQMVLDWSKKQGCVYVCSVRDLENDASRALFKKASFNQSEVIWMDRNL